MVVVLILWMMFGMLHLITYLPAVSAVENRKDQIFVSLIFLVAGPVFTLVTILEYIITMILGDDWNDNGDEDKKV